MGLAKGKNTLFREPSTIRSAIDRKNRVREIAERIARSRMRSDLPPLPPEDLARTASDHLRQIEHAERVGPDGESPMKRLERAIEKIESSGSVLIPRFEITATYANVNTRRMGPCIVGRTSLWRSSDPMEKAEAEGATGVQLLAAQARARQAASQIEHIRELGQPFIEDKVNRGEWVGKLLTLVENTYNQLNGDVLFKFMATDLHVLAVYTPLTLQSGFHEGSARTVFEAIFEVDAIYKGTRRARFDHKTKTITSNKR